MKKFLILLLFISAGIYAQDNKHEKIKAYKTAYITEKLELSPKEAEEFWPVYNLYDQKFRDVRKRERDQIFKKIGDNTCDISDSDAAALIKIGFALEEETLQIKREMNTALSASISPKKIILLRKVENDFKRELLHRYRGAHHGKTD